MNRGGDGIIREYEFLVPADVTVLSDRRKRGPYGLRGGTAGQTGRNSLSGKTVAAKANFAAKTGDILRIESPGGGGWGQSPIT